MNSTYVESNLVKYAILLVLPGPSVLLWEVVPEKKRNIKGLVEIHSQSSIYKLLDIWLKA